MDDDVKTKGQPIDGFAELRRQNAQLRPSETGRDLLEEHLKIMENAIESSINAIGITDLYGKVLYVNDSLIKMWGYDNKEEILGRPLPEFWEGLGILNTIKSLSESGKATGEDIGKRRDGSLFTAQFSANTIRDESGNPIYIFGSFIDITGQKKIENALRASEEKYRIVVENANEAILVAQDGIFMFSNPKVTELVGYSESELVSKPFVNFIHPDDREMVATRHLKRLKGEELPETYPFRIIHRDGSAKWVEINTALIDWEGRPATLNLLNDITERIQTENALRASEDRYRAVSELTSDYSYAYRVEPNGDLVNEWVTGALVRITGYTADELHELGGWSHLMHPEDMHIALGQLQKLLAGQPGVVEYRILSKSGEMRWMRDYARPVMNGEAVTHIYGGVQDITQ